MDVASYFAQHNRRLYALIRISCGLPVRSPVSRSMTRQRCSKVTSTCFKLLRWQSSSALWTPRSPSGRRAKVRIRLNHISTTHVPLSTCLLRLSLSLCPTLSWHSSHCSMHHTRCPFVLVPSVHSRYHAASTTRACTIVDRLAIVCEWIFRGHSWSVAAPTYALLSVACVVSVGAIAALRRCM
jgi:hypothetical protein